MELAHYEAWLNAREQHRHLLFGDSIEVTPDLGNIATTPLATLAYNTRLDGGTTLDERLARTDLLSATHHILNDHNAVAAEEQQAIFGISSSKDMKRIADLTAGVIFRWELACRRQGRTSPFMTLLGIEVIGTDFGREDVQLVVETASATAEIIGLGYKASDDINGRDCKNLMNLVAHRGPLFATSWIRGDIIRNAYIDRGDDPEIALSITSRALLANYAVNHSRNPLHAILRYIDNLVVALSPDKLVTELGWDPKKVSTFFPLSTRHLVAKKWRDSPLTGARLVADRLDTILTTEHIALFLGEDPEYVNTLFTPAERSRIATYDGPMDHIKRISTNFRTLTSPSLATSLGLSEAEALELFPPSYYRRLSTSADLMPRLQAAVKTFKTTLAVGRIARELGWTEVQTSEVFKLPVRRNIAISYPGARALDRVRDIATTRQDLIRRYQLPIEITNFLSSYLLSESAIFAAKKTQAEIANCPPYTSLTVWMWTVALDPRATRDKWMRTIAAYDSFLKVTRPLSASKPTTRNEEFQLSDGVSDLVDGIFSDEPGAYLQELAAKAGVPHEALRRLMVNLKEDEGALAAPDRLALEKLRNAYNA